MKVIDLRPPPACLKSYRLKFSLFTKKFIIFTNKAKLNKISNKIVYCCNEMNILQYVCPQYPHSMKFQIIFTEMAKLAHIFSAATA